MMTKPKSQSSDAETQDKAWQQAQEEADGPSALVFRNPIPGGQTMSEATEDIRRGEGRYAGGFFFTEPETRQRMWIPDSNVIGAKFG